MTEFRRLKMKIGEAEFEADVPESEVQPMYCQFLMMVERRSQISHPAPAAVHGADAAKTDTREFAAEAVAQPIPAYPSPAYPSPLAPRETFDRASLDRVFTLGDDGALTLKVLPPGPDSHADALLLILYGYYRLKNEAYVLATQLFRAAERSGIVLRRPVTEYVRNSRFVIRGGQRKGSHYSLSNQGLAMATEITAKMVG
jgi:hypothetical protein